MIKRETYLNRIIPFVDTELIKVITGVRRSGKSVMLQLVQDYLVEQGVKRSQILALNFEELINEQYLDYHVLNKHIEDVIAANNGKTYVFLDEIQAVHSFEKTINSLRASHRDSVDIYITGSNAKLLSGELATLLSGRYVRFEIYPFTFSEFVQGKRSIGINASNNEFFQMFMLEGGMPFPIFQDLAYKDRVNYLSDVYSSIMLKDIIERETIREPELLRRLLNYLFANSGRTFSANSIVKHLKSQGMSASVTTILNYLRYAQSAYAIVALPRYDIQGKKYFSSHEKYYVIDHGLRQAIVGRNIEDVELVLENIVLFELISRGYAVKVGKTDRYEVDFVAEKMSRQGMERAYFQVSYLLAAPETREREFRALESIPDNHAKTVLSMDPITSSSGGIMHKNLIEWLLE